MEQALMKLALAFMGGAGHYFMFETMQRMRQNRDSSISHQDNDSSFSLMFLGMAASIEHNYKKAAENFIKLKLDSKQWQINYIIGIGLSKACWDDLHDTLKIDYQEKAINAFTIALEDESLDEDKRAELYIRRAESRMVYVCAAQKLNLAIDVNIKNTILLETQKGIDDAKSKGLLNWVEQGTYILGCSYALFDDQNNAQNTYIALLNMNENLAEKMICRIKERYNPNMQLESKQIDDD